MIKDVADRAALVAETHAAREAFAHSAEVIGEYLYSGERKPDEQFVMHAHGRGLAALLGAPEETQELVDDYDDFVHPDDRPEFDVAWRFADLIRRDGEIVRAGVPSRRRRRRAALGARSRRDHGARRPRAADRRGTRHLRPAACRGRARRGRRRLEWLSSVDALTELFNRRHFSEVLRARLAGSAAGAAIALVDVDHFKRINDTHGHQIGDLVLREIARRLKDATRPCDVTSRWGGEEFCVLLDEIGDDEELEILVERLRGRGRGHADPDRRERQPSRSRSRSAPCGRLPTATRPSSCSRAPTRRSTRPSAAGATRRASRAARRCSCRWTRARASRASCRRWRPRPRSAAASARCTPRRSRRCRRPSPSSSALPAATVELARLGGWLHDCGKVTVPTDILAHRGPLDEKARAPCAPSRGRRRGARERRARPERRGSGGAQPSRALRRRRLSRRPGRRRRSRSPRASWRRPTPSWR